MPAIVTIRPATTAQDLETIKVLLREYAVYLNQSLGEEHICLEAYEKELADLPGVYAEPQGVILMALAGEKLAGCVALKPLKAGRAIEAGEAACEMKRLWVRPEFRGQSVGLALAKELIQHAQGCGYTAMYLDTVPMAMQSANGIYKKLGFQAVERYNTNPILGMNPAVAVEFFRLAIKS
jgi:putative acetyltransferase